MNLKTGPRSHFGEADLVRYMDRQLDREALRQARHHLANCPACAEQLAEAERRSAAVRDMIALLPVELPDPGKRAIALAALDRARTRRSATGPLGGGFLRAAAVAALLICAGVATRPGRAWMADTVRDVAGERPGPFAARVLALLGEAPPSGGPSEVSVRTRGTPATPGQAVAAARPPALPPGASPPVRFTPNGSEVVIHFESLQRGGSATLWLRDVAEATGQITSGGRGETLIPMENGVRVQNRPNSRADYMLTVPVHFRMVRVQVGDGPETVIPVSKSKRNWIWTITLRESDQE